MLPGHKFFLILILSFSFLFNSCALGHKIEEKFEKEVEFVESGLISLSNTNGAVYVDSWAKPVVKVVAIKSVRGGSHNEAEEFMKEVKINIEEFSNEIRISAEYPRQDSFSGFWSLLTGSGKPSVTISYELTVPENSELDIRTTNGAIEIRNISDNISARTTNGSVKLENVSGNIQAKSTNGAVKASLQTFQTNGEIEMHTTNGRIELELPETVSSELSARTTNGKISTDFPVTVQGGLSSRKIEGTIGAGDGKIDLRTTNGSITIRSR